MRFRGHPLAGLPDGRRRRGACRLPADLQRHGSGRLVGRTGPLDRRGRCHHRRHNRRQSAQAEYVSRVGGAGTGSLCSKQLRITSEVPFSDRGQLRYPDSLARIGCGASVVRGRLSIRPLAWRRHRRAALRGEKSAQPRHPAWRCLCDRARRTAVADRRAGRRHEATVDPSQERLERGGHSRHRQPHRVHEERREGPGSRRSRCGAPQALGRDRPATARGRPDEGAVHGCLAQGTACRAGQERSEERARLFRGDARRRRCARSWSGFGPRPCQPGTREA